jgi:hypothetical protein
MNLISEENAELRRMNQKFSKELTNKSKIITEQSENISANEHK